MTFEEWYNKYNELGTDGEQSEKSVSEAAWEAAIKEYAKQRLESEGIRCY